MDPNIEEAEEKQEQASRIETTAADLRAGGNTDTAVELETTAANLRQEAEQERTDAQTRADKEKSEVDQKYGTA